MSQTLNAIGLGLDIIGFSILFALAIPALMRRTFVTSDRVSLDGFDVGPDQFARLAAHGDARPPEHRRRKRQAFFRWVGGLTVLFGFLLQLLALFVPYGCCSSVPLAVRVLVLLSCNFGSQADAP